MFLDAYFFQLQSIGGIYTPTPYYHTLKQSINILYCTSDVFVQFTSIPQHKDIKKSIENDMKNT